MIRAKTILTALALVALTAAGDARAAFTYSVAPLSTTTAIGSSGLSSMTVAAANNGLLSNTLSGTQIISIAQINELEPRCWPWRSD
ncbi:MAG: hypothetical protein U0835_16295 [Isosphaeraceae bacterium]